MKIRTTIRIDVDAGGDEELEERVLDLAQEEVMKFSASLADRLEADGIEDVEIDVQGDG